MIVHAGIFSRYSAMRSLTCNVPVIQAPVQIVISPKHQLSESMQFKPNTAWLSVWPSLANIIHPAKATQVPPAPITGCIYEL
jgi:hypothetical protein